MHKVSVAHVLIVNYVYTVHVDSFCNLVLPDSGARFRCRIQVPEVEMEMAYIYTTGYVELYQVYQLGQELMGAVDEVILLLEMLLHLKSGNR